MPEITTSTGPDTTPSIGFKPDLKDTDRAEIYLDGTLVLVGCGKAKRDPEDPQDLHQAVVGPDESTDLGREGPLWRAEDLYTATYSNIKREFAETVTRYDEDGDAPEWAILSAEHEILYPWQKVAPYNTTVTDLDDDPTNPEHRVGMPGRRPDGQEIVTEMDQWASMVAYGLARWLAMHRDRKAAPHSTNASTLLVLAGQDYIQPLRERGVFEYGASRMSGDPNDAYELDVSVRYLFEEIDAGGIGEQMGWLSAAIDRLESEFDGRRTEQAALDGDSV